jgi:hypothetical protein
MKYRLCLIFCVQKKWQQIFLYIRKILGWKETVYFVNGVNQTDYIYYKEDRDFVSNLLKHIEKRYTVHKLCCSMLIFIQSRLWFMHLC